MIAPVTGMDIAAWAARSGCSSGEPLKNHVLSAQSESWNASCAIQDQAVSVCVLSLSARRVKDYILPHRPSEPFLIW